MLNIHAFLTHSSFLTRKYIKIPDYLLSLILFFIDLGWKKWPQWHVIGHLLNVTYLYLEMKQSFTVKKSQ